MEALEYLKAAVAGKDRLDELVTAFEEMCKIPIEGDDEKMILFETGIYPIAGTPLFVFSLARQYQYDDEEYCQMVMDVMFEPTADTDSLQQATWSCEMEESIFGYVRRSQEYSLLKESPIAGVDISFNET